MLRQMSFVLCLVMGANVGHGQNAPDGGTRAVPQFNELESWMQRILRRDLEDAIERFADMIVDVDANGRLDEAAIARKGALMLASLRAKRLRDLMQYDLDFNGTLDADELSIATAAAQTSGRSLRQILLTSARADTNADGALSFEEILDSVRTQIPDYERGDRRLKEYRQLIEVFDLNDDGTLIIPEMIQAVDAIKVGCRC